MNAKSPHAAYADPIDGGFGGYQAACWDCDWRSSAIHHDKRVAQDEAGVHAESERASLPDRVEAAARRIATGVCANCGWTRDAVLNDGRVLFVAWHHGPAGVREPKKCYECRTWSSMPALAAADACEAERNPNTTDEYVQVGWYFDDEWTPPRMSRSEWESERLVTSRAVDDEDGLAPPWDKRAKPVFVRRPVSSEDVHREERT